MTWGAPENAWLLLAALPLALLQYRATRLRQQSLLDLTGPNAPAGVAAAPTARLTRGLIRVCALLLMVTALCRPQWGRVLASHPSQGRDILIALDVSRSMLADDMKPNRLTAARQAIAELAATLRKDRIGLIAFSGSAFLICPLTNDFGVFSAVALEANTDSIPVAGTSLESALREAARTFRPSPRQGTRTLIVISDGEDHRGAGIQAATELARDGITVHTVLTGTVAGGLIPTPQGGFHRDPQGAVVKSRANSDLLRAVATAGGGQCLDLVRDSLALKRLCAAMPTDPTQREVRGARLIPVERFQICVALSLVLLLAEPLLGGWGGRK